MKIYRFVNFLNEVESKIDEVEFLSWLYLLGTEYPTGFVKKSWENDNRMGLVASVAMEEGIRRGFVKENSDKWNITDEGVSAYMNFFLRNTEEDTNKLVDSLKKYNRVYPIYRIPSELQLYLRIKNRKKTFQKKLDKEDYRIINNFLEKYQRVPETSTNKIKQFAGCINELCEDKDYVLYRGINVKEGLFKDGDLVTSHKDVQSWTTSKDIAEQFAWGNPTPMQNTVSKNRFNNSIGIILKHTFKPADIIFDFVYIDDTNENIEIFWTTENEVLVNTRKKAFEIYKIV